MQKLRPTAANGFKYVIPQRRFRGTLLEFDAETSPSLASSPVTFSDDGISNSTPVFARYISHAGEDDFAATVFSCCLHCTEATSQAAVELLIRGVTAAPAAGAASATREPRLARAVAPLRGLHLGQDVHRYRRPGAPLHSSLVIQTESADANKVEPKNSQSETNTEIFHLKKNTHTHKRREYYVIVACV